MPVGATNAGEVSRGGWRLREGEIAATPGEVLGSAKKASCLSGEQLLLELFLFLCLFVHLIPLLP